MNNDQTRNLYICRETYFILKGLINSQSMSSRDVLKEISKVMDEKDWMVKGMLPVSCSIIRTISNSDFIKISTRSQDLSERIEFKLMTE